MSPIIPNNSFRHKEMDIYISISWNELCILLLSTFFGSFIFINMAWSAESHLHSPFSVYLDKVCSCYLWYKTFHTLTTLSDVCSHHKPFKTHLYLGSPSIRQGVNVVFVLWLNLVTSMVFCSYWHYFDWVRNRFILKQKNLFSWILYLLIVWCDNTFMH